MYAINYYGAYSRPQMSRWTWPPASILQINAMQAGLLKVVPQAVLDLLTWQEVEKKVCGDPEISVDALKRLSECPDLNHFEFTQYEYVEMIRFIYHAKCKKLKCIPVLTSFFIMELIFVVFYILLAHYEDLEPSNIRVQYLWEALTNFTNGEFALCFMVYCFPA